MVILGRSVTLTTLYLGRLRPSIKQYSVSKLSPVTYNCLFESVLEFVCVCGGGGGGGG